MSPRNRKVSIREVAELAGVSLGTVSNVLNSPDKVRADTRERVRKAMRELGFVRSYAASQLRKRGSNTVGIIVLDIKNPFFMEAAAAIEKRLRRDGCHLMLASSDGSPAREAELLDSYAGMDVRGIILTPSDTSTTAGRQALVKKIDDLGLPVVLFDHPPVSSKYPAVYVDDRVGEERAVAHLLQLGHRRIAFLNGPDGIRQSQDRLEGARSAFAKAGLDVDDLVVATAARYRTPDGADVVRTLMQQHPEITAIACANDLLAIGASIALREMGLRVSEDVSLVGYDDIDIARQLSTPLTSIHQPMNGMGWSAAGMLLEASGTASEGGVNDPQEDSENGEVESLSLHPELVVRSSTAEPRRD